MPPKKRPAKELLTKGTSKPAGGQDPTTVEATILTTHIPQTSQNHSTRPTIMYPLSQLHIAYPTTITQTVQPKTEPNTLPPPPPQQPESSPQSNNFPAFGTINTIIGASNIVTPRVSNPHDYINHIFKRP
jgi:hypothetical protein